MHDQSYTNLPGYLFIVAGLLLSLLSALVPHFEAGYMLTASVFFAGMFPYMIYAIAVPLLPGTATTVTGLVVLVAHAWLVFNERIIGHGEYSSDLIYYGPFVIALVALPVALIALKKSTRFGS